MLKAIIRKMIPEPMLGWYHLALAKMAAFVFRHPSDCLIVIGVTGTKGKSSTVQFLGCILEHAGYTVGWTSTAGFKVGKNESENNKKITIL